MQRRRVIKSILGGCVFLSGCSSDSDLATPSPDETETETPDYPEVGELYIKEFEPDDDWKDPVWDLALELDDDYTDGTLKVIEIDERAGYRDELIDRINLRREGPILRFPYIRDDSVKPQVQLPRNKYLFRLEVDGEVVAESRFNIHRDISVDEVQFESHIGGEEYEYEPQVLDFGKTSFSVRIENTGNAPSIIETVAARDMDHYVLSGFWLNGELQYSGHSYRTDILPPGESKRYGAVGYTLPRLERVDEVCDGSKRTTVLQVETDVRDGNDGWRYELTYTLGEPASGTGLPALHHDQEKFVCESGEIIGFSEINSD